MIGGRLIGVGRILSGMRDWVHLTRPRDTMECERGAAATLLRLGLDGVA